MIDTKKQYKTRSGLLVTILTTTAKGLYHGPVVGLIQGFEGPSVWSSEGQYAWRRHSYHPEESNLDLLEVKLVREGWVNIYPRPDKWNNDGYWYKTREDADKQASPDRIACIKITFTEGEGL